MPQPSRRAPRLLALRHRYPKKGDYGGIWNAVHNIKSDKLLKRAPVINLEFKLFMAGVKKLLKNKYLEGNQYINPLELFNPFALLEISLFEQWL